MNWESWAEPSGISWNDVPGFAATAPLNLQRNLPAEQFNMAIENASFIDDLRMFTS